MNSRQTWSLPLLLALFFGPAGPGCASHSNPPERKHFASPDAAVEALVAALRADDHDKLKQVLGPAVDDILPSGDDLADRADVARFLELYDDAHQVQPQADARGASTLLVGEGKWPFPVPIVHSGGGYVFDTAAGKEEILNRRIGRNELNAEQVCLAIADAQREYVRLNPAGAALPEYARKIVSDPGTKNGLYWPTAEGEPASPLGPLAAAAAAEGHGTRGGPSTQAATQPAVQAGETRDPPPYHGYVYRLLTSQGPHAHGGPVDYVVDGRLIGGFAVVAWPAQYGSSGIMTFMTNHEGVVYQRDLGPATQSAGRAMTRFDPGPEWTRATGGAQLGQVD